MSNSLKIHKMSLSNREKFCHNLNIVSFTEDERKQAPNEWNSF